MPPRSKRPNDAPDYRHRWPTQQTLVAPAEADKSKRIKALHSISMPLLWLNMKIEEWQDNIDEHVKSIEAKRQERSSNPDLRAPRKGIFGTPRPGKSTHPYDTGADPIASSESIPVVEPPRADSPDPPENPHTRPRMRMLLRRLSHKAEATSESDPGHGNNQPHIEPAQPQHIPTGQSGNPETRGKSRRSSRKKSELPTAQPPEPLVESDQARGAKPSKKRKASWKSVQDRRSTPHPEAVRETSTATAQPTSISSSPKNKQKVAGAPASTVDSGPSMPNSPITRFLGGLVGHSFSPRASTPRDIISPLDINSLNSGAGTQYTSLLSPPRPSQETRASEATSSTWPGARAWFSLKRSLQENAPPSPVSIAEGGVRPENRCPACGYCKPVEPPEAKPDQSISHKDTRFKRSRKRSRTE